MGTTKKIIDAAIATLQLPIDVHTNIRGYTSVVMESIIVGLLKNGYRNVASTEIKDCCGNKRYTTAKVVLLIDSCVYNYYIITIHVKMKSIWKVTCKKSCYNEVMDVAYNNGYLLNRYSSESNEICYELENQLKGV